MQLQIKKDFKNPIHLAFLASILCWIYLALDTRMIIAWDAIDYESLGKMLAQQGWAEFFKTGPNREPFYPALIAFSMGIGKIFSVPYQFVQILIQFFIIFLTQILALCILRIMKINDLLSALTVLYLGISPAILNSALSLYSEVATYPFILAIVLLIYRSWLSLDGPKIRVVLLAIITSLLFVIMVLNKGIFELITPVFFFLLLVSVIFTRNRRLIVSFGMYLVIFLTVFYSSVNCYKSVNKIFNGRFTVTNRGAWALYGETALRMEPLTRERFFIALASVPGEGVSKFMFGKEGDHYSPGRMSDEVGRQKMNELRKCNISDEAIYNTLVSLSEQKALQNPFKYIFFTAMEGLKMLFWESTQIGYVAYPVALAKAFAQPVLRNGLRLSMSLLTLFALAYMVVLIWRKRKSILREEGPPLFIYLCLLFTFSFIGSYSIFWIITRYALPIAPLYLVIIAYFLQEVFFHVD